MNKRIKKIEEDCYKEYLKGNRFFNNMEKMVFAVLLSILIGVALSLVIVGSYYLAESYGYVNFDVHSNMPLVWIMSFAIILSVYVVVGIFVFKRYKIGTIDITTPIEEMSCLKDIDCEKIRKEFNRG